VSEEDRVRRTSSAEEELGLLVDAVQDYAIFLLGTDGEIRSWNPGAARIFGYPADEVIGRKFSAFYGAEDLAKPAAELRAAERDGRVEDEGWRVRKDGTRFWANTVITALRDDRNQLHGFAEVTRDLTRRRAAEERLRASEEVFRLLVASVREYAIFMLDPQGRIATWNAGAERLKGYKPEEIIGRHFSVFYPEQDVRDGKPERKLQLAQERGSIEDEGWRVRKDGTKFWANVVITAVFDSAGTLRGFAKVTRDLTEQKRASEMQRALFEQREARLVAEEERRRAEASHRASQEANRAKDEFLMTLSHELRTPMTVILGWARLLPTMSHDDPLFKDAIAAIGRSAQLQSRLIDDVLDVSRVISGKLRLDVTEVDLAQVINSAVEVVHPSADAKQITITTSFAPGLGSATGDKTRLQQVMWNLLSNAVKFTPKFGTIDVSARRTNSRVEIVVRDSGEGIDDQFLPHIFEPFRQAEGPRTRIHGGLGLGLSIVRYLVEAHGGTVTAESAGRGRGASFTVMLPIAAVAVDRRPDAAGIPELPRPGLLAGTDVLLVDDDRESRELIGAALRQAGARVTLRDSAVAALEVLEESRPDVVITDIAMPRMDGYAFLREVRRRPALAGLKVIALTAFSGPIPAEEQGFDEYHTKPIDPFELVRIVSRVTE
jgi:PAS domain S-box-containing protein